MCGISGIIDQKPVTRNLLTSIANLEYRGYDSCGMAMLMVKELRFVKIPAALRKLGVVKNSI